VRLGGHCLIVLERTLQAAHPQEGCALLLGRLRRENSGDALLVQRIWPCSNRWEPAAERHRHFRLDPREQLLAQRWARDRGLQVLGAAHSHPTSAAVPSDHDRRMCLGPCLMLIRSGRRGESQPLRAWWLQDPGGRDAAVQGPPLPLALPLLTGAEDLGE